MSYYGQNQQEWHQHSQTSNYNTTSPVFSPQANGTTQNEQQQQRTGPLGPVISQTINNLVNQIKSSEYLKTTCGFLSLIEVVASLIIFIIASNMNGHPFLTLLSGFAFWIALAFLMINLFEIPEKINTVPWVNFQLGFCAIAAVLLFLETLVVFFSSSVILSLLVLHLAALFGYHGYDKLKEYGRIINERTQQNTNPQQSTNLNV